MIPFGGFLFFLNFFYFLFASFLTWYIPGRVVLGKIKLTLLAQSVLSIILGISLWGWQGIIFGYLHVRFLSYLYILIFLISFLKNKTLLPKFKKISIDWILAIVIFLGVMLQLFGIFPMGTKVANGITLCCGDVSDNNLDLSIISELVQRVPPFEPGMYGQPMQNYHYWNHMVLADIIRVFHLPLIATVYQYAVVFYSILFGFVLIAVSEFLFKNKIFTRWLVFFSYFGGDGAYTISLLHGQFGFPIGALEHGAQLFFNYPRAVSLIIFFGGFSLFLLWVREKKKSIGIFVAIVLGSVIGFKVYTGLFVIVGAISSGLFFLLRKKFSSTLPLFLLAVLSICIYYPVNAHAGGLFYTGFWRVNDFIVLGGLGLSQLELAREVYEKAGNFLHAYIYEIGFLVLYVLITWGTKIVGIFQTKKSLAHFPQEANIFLIPSLITSFVIGMFFWQKIGGANTFNFLVSVLIIGNIYVALALTFWIGKLARKVQFVAITAIVLLTLPRVVVYAQQTYGQLHATAFIGPKELSALSYLRENTPKTSVYFAEPQIASEHLSPYIPYMTNRASFLSGEFFELKEHGINFKDREQVSDEVFNNLDASLVVSKLKKNNVNYIYMFSKDELPAASTSSLLKKDFDNGYIKIYQVL